MFQKQPKCGWLECLKGFERVMQLSCQDSGVLVLECLKGFERVMQLSCQDSGVRVLVRYAINIFCAFNIFSNKN